MWEDSENGVCVCGQCCFRVDSFMLNLLLCACVHTYRMYPKKFNTADENFEYF